MRVNKKNKSTRIFKVIWWKLLPYIKIARIDHWFKNVFMLLGILLAFFMKPHLSEFIGVFWLLISILSVCLIASSNYVLNEILDAETDKFHPTKMKRPIPAGKVYLSFAYFEWTFLGALGILMGFFINSGFGFSCLFLWIMGIIYNVPPIRSKEIVYFDVLSESINNPIRLLLGWFILIPDKIPPVSLLISYWMIGAFFMGLKRFAEYRNIADPKKASQYRKSFSYYNEERLLISVFFYAMVGSLFTGVFIVRYHLELLFFLPVFAFFITYYFKMGFLNDSPVQNPEKLYKERNFVVIAIFSLIFFIILMFVKIPILYKLFHVQEDLVTPLWMIGK